MTRSKKPPTKRVDSLNGTDHRAVMAAERNPPLVPSRVFTMDIPGAEFFKYLNKHVVSKIGYADPGFERNITFQSVPDRGVIELTVIDSPPGETQQ